MQIFEKDKQFIANTYARFNVALVNGKGSLIYDTNGKEYIDLGTGIGVNLFGVADEEWRNAVIKQLGKIQHTSNLYYNEPCAELAEKLCTRTGMSKAFFSNSGAESNECAIKAARKFASEKYGADCYKIITLWNSFHGRTLTNLAATGQDHYHELFQPLTPGFLHAHTEISEIEKLCAENKNQIAAIMIECIQGEGGVIPISEKFADDLKKFLDANKNILLIVDEVQTGNGRTGKLFAYEHFNFKPDIVTTAKGIGGGLPIGITMLNAKLQDVFQPGDNGSTFGGNPVVCAGACNILDRLDEKLLNEVARKGKLLREKLSSSKAIADVAGIGLMLGIKPANKKASDVVKTCLENGVLCLTAKDRIRLLPAVNIPEELLLKAADVIIKACED